MTKLQTDLRILEAIAESMPRYLESDIIFGQAMAEKVTPTIGGYLIRQHRLTALQESLLNQTEQNRLNKAIQQVEQSRQRQASQFEFKAQKELGARVRHWQRILPELLSDFSPAYYRTEVEKRLMITLLSAYCDVKPFAKTVDDLDDQLRKQWQAGSLVWDKAWEPAYPSAQYWWLYGSIRD